MNRRVLAGLLALIPLGASFAFAAPGEIFVPERAVPALPPALSASGAAVSGALTAPSLSVLAAPALSAPALAPSFAAAPAVAAPAAVAASPSAAVAAQAEAVAPLIQAIASPNVSGEDSSRAVSDAALILQGGVLRGGAASAIGGAAAADDGPRPTLAGASPARETAAAPAPVSAPAAPRGPAAVDSRSAYRFARAFLASVATTFGVNFSLPPAGPRLTADLLAEAATKRAVLSDVDDTLAKYSTVLTHETVDAIVAVRRAGKLFAAITDRPDSVKPGSSQMSAFDSLASIPAADRAGILVATNGGGKIYEYDAAGTPKLIFEEPALPESVRPAIAEAANSVKALLPGLGVSVKSEFNSPYGYGMILMEGTPEAAVKSLAASLQTELRSRGVDYEVEGRMAKDPKLPPYLTFSKLDKSVAAARIAELKKISAGDAVILGDSMYAPKHNENLSPLGRAAVAAASRIAGPLPLTGNSTDRNMERALPGALTLSVGGSADAGMANAYVLEGKGPEVTRRVLAAAASRPLGYGEKIALEETRLADLHRAEALAIPGAKGVSATALYPYGLGHDSFSVNVRFDDAVTALAAARAGRFKELAPASDGSRVYMSWSLPNGAEAAYFSGVESRMKAEYAGIPGVAGSRIVEYSAYGAGVNLRGLEVFFKDEASLDAARAAGTVPLDRKTVEVNEDVRGLARRYVVSAQVGEPLGDSRLQDALSSGRASEKPLSPSLFARADLGDAKSMLQRAFFVLSESYGGVRLESARIAVVDGKAGGWTATFWGRRRGWLSWVSPYTRLNVTLGTGGAVVAEGETRWRPGARTLDSASVGKTAYVGVEQAIAKAAVYYPDVKVESVSLTPERVEWYEPAMMPMDSGSTYSKIVPTYAIKGRSTADAKVEIVQPLVADDERGAVALSAAKVAGAATAETGTAWATLTLFADMNDFTAATSKRPLRAILDARRQALLARYGVEWISPEIDTLDIPNQSGGDVGRYFTYRIKLPLAQYERLKEDGFRRDKAMVTLGYVEPK